jgi:hypothetical protein
MTDPELDEIIRDIVEWMDGWEWYEGGFYKMCSVEMLMTSPGLVIEIRKAIVDEGYEVSYGKQFEKFEPPLDFSPTEELLLDIEPRLRTLHRTLREAGEITDD